MRDIASVAQLSLGGIYFHFSAKADIFQAICDETYGAVLTKWRSGGLDQSETSRVRIRRIADANLGLLECDPDHFRLALVLNGAAVVDEGLKAIKRAHHTGYVGFIASVLETGVTRGELRPHDARAVAEGIVAIFDGLYLRCAIDADVHPRTTVFAALDLLLDALESR